MRVLRRDELGALARLNAYVFAKPDPARVQAWLESMPPKSWSAKGAFVKGALAGTLWTRHYTMRANGRDLALAAIAGVGTDPEYRRRGLLRRLITDECMAMRARGQHVAALWASQAAIYQRYGFGT